MLLLADQVICEFGLFAKVISRIVVEVGSLCGLLRRSFCVASSKFSHWLLVAEKFLLYAGTLARSNVLVAGVGFRVANGLVLVSTKSLLLCFHRNDVI